MAKLTAAVIVAGLVAIATAAQGATLRVPQQHVTIQDAVNAAAAGDRISVGAGAFCGAVIDKRVTLVGHGNPRIIGCAGGPALQGVLRIGFLLDGASGHSPASGSEITGFVFDGDGVSNANLNPLAFGVLARFAHDVQVTRNRFVGTTQAITNTGGDRWLIWQNQITDLSLLDCTHFCGGGAGIVIQSVPEDIEVGGVVDPDASRVQFNFIASNHVDGAVPAGFNTFSMVGILILAADQTSVWNNDLALKRGAGAGAAGEGINVTDRCCGDQVVIDPGARDTVLALNDGRRSQFAIVVEGSGGTNTEGLVLFGNRGAVQIEGRAVARVAAGAAALALLQRQLFF
ncbi:MAG TPA: hypothetical protein VFH73_13455 [Polyangia bacterium]|jgi:nitrous oxidase accessory protein NosD|nr:hypothetical protein [Polyangia bacterium]